MPTHGMDITRDRAFLGKPREWPFRVDGGFACAIKRPSFVEASESHATVVCIDGEYGLVRDSIHEVLSGEARESENTTIEAILADDWIVD